MKKDTQNGFAQANQENFYGDFPTAHIDALYRKGKFYDLEDNQPIALSESALVRLVVYRKDIPKENQERFYSTARRVLNQGSVLQFCLPCWPGTLKYIELTFKVKLLEDLVFEKKGNKPARALNVSCEVFDREGYVEQPFESFTVKSLNQAFFQASVRHRPEARSHVTNIYQKFYIDGTDRTLETLRF